MSEDKNKEVLKIDYNEAWMIKTSIEIYKATSDRIGVEEKKTLNDLLNRIEQKFDF